MRYVLPVTILAAMLLLPAAVTAQNQNSADTTVAAARQAAQNDQYETAATLFRKAIEQDPSRRPQLLREYADQLTYAGHPNDAIPLYQELLASDPLSRSEARSVRLGLANALASANQGRQAAGQYRLLIAQDPKDSEARLDYAQLLWDQGDLGAARVQYTTVLAQDPQNEEAQENYARLESWRGRYRESKQLSEAYLRQHKDDRQSRLTLAQDELWMGRPDEAAPEVNSLLQSDPKNGDAKSLLAQVRDSTAPQLRASYESATQSNDLLIQNGHIGADMTPDSGRTTIGAFFDRFRYSATNEDAEIVVQKPGVRLSHSFSDWSQLTASFASDNISAAEDPSINRNIPTYDAVLALRANDTFQVGLESRRQIFDDLLSLAKGISADFNTISLQLTPDERTSGEMHFSQASYSDGNREQLFEMGIDREVLHRPNLTVGLAGTTLGFSEQLNNGYFNPSSYWGVVATTELSSSMGRRFDYSLSADIGEESTNPGGKDTAYDLSASLSYRLGGPSALNIYYDAYNTYQAASSGFGRHVLGVSLTQKL